MTLGRSKRSAGVRGTSRDFRVRRSTITETEKIEGAIITFTYNLASKLPCYITWRVSYLVI